MPNRLKIKVDFGKDPVLGNGNITSGVINAKWLFGAVGKKPKSKDRCIIGCKENKFAKFASYEFDNPTTDYSTQSKTISDWRCWMLKAMQH
jgi:hypothetical protein